MTPTPTSRLLRLAVVVLALACLSPASLQLSSLATLPALLGFVPEPEPTPVPTPATVFEPIDPGPATPLVTMSQREARYPERAAPPRTRPPRPDRAAGSSRTGSSLPVLPPDEVPRGRYHRVEDGDSIASIASAYGLTSKWAVYDANPIIVNPDAPPVGAWLYIPHPSMSPQPRPRPGESGYSETPSATVIVDGIWLQLAQCESSGDWGINTGNGYFGGLQFTLSSWRAVGGAGYPHQAHPMEQIARADYLQRIQGWDAWPMCSGKLGLIPKERADAIVEAARQRQRKHGGPTVEDGQEASEAERSGGEADAGDGAAGANGSDG